MMLEAPGSPTQADVPQEYMGTLVENFFSHIHFANLLFHKETFLRDLAAGNVPANLRLAIAAISARFPSTLMAIDRRFLAIDSVERNLEPRKRGRQWAERASAITLQHVDQPSLQKLQAVLILALYWFGAGEIGRAFMHHGIAVHIIRALRSGHYKEEFHDDFIHHENKKRVFWACFMGDCFVTTQEGPARALVELALKMPLPCPENDYISGKTQRKDEFLHGEGNESVFAGVLQGAHMW
jgi:Fungal specific transcription factor domain